MNKVHSWSQLRVYQDTFTLQETLFEISRKWPKSETFSLTDQILRSSRSIGANIAEAWAKRRYPAHFRSKLTDSDGELQETIHWIRTAESCKYLTSDQSKLLQNDAMKIGAQLGKMINNHQSFCF